LSIEQAEAKPKSAASTKGSSILIAIDKPTQKMSVFVGGTKKYDWRVSTGRPSYSTPSGTYTATSMNEVWYSKEWDNAPMPHAIFFMTDGHAVHGSYEVKSLGRPVSHGCVRIAPKNATTLYALVEKNGLKNTQVVLTGDTPGGEYEVASRAAGQKSHVASRPNPKRIAAIRPKAASQGGKFSYAHTGPDPFPRRRGFFGRLLGPPSEVQGYYRSTPTRGY